MNDKLEKCIEFLNDLQDSDKDFVVTSKGELIEPVKAQGCAVSYVNCRMKKTEIVNLQPGETFFYGDWDGQKCVRKTFTC